MDISSPSSQLRAVNMCFLKVEDFELVFAPAILPAPAPPHSVFPCISGFKWEGNRTVESLLNELCSHPFTSASFIWLQLHTSVSPTLSLVPSSTEPPCLQFLSQPNLVCLHPLFFKVSSSQNICLIKSISPSASTESIKETDKKQATPCRPPKA